MLENDLTYEDFRDEWLRDVTDGEPSTLELGRRFARKLVTQWLDFEDDSDDIVYCDGSGDGGIDIAALVRGDGGEADGSSEGDTWYLVQSKYGSALRGPGTVLEEGQKVVDTLDGRRLNLSSLAAGLQDRLLTFRDRMSDRDRFVLVLATDSRIGDAERRALADVSTIGRERLGTAFEVAEVSIETIFRRMQEAPADVLKVELEGNLVEAGGGLLVGVVHLEALYRFLRQYQSETHDLDRLYERNVRQFLGSGRKINKAIQHTLLHNPERFGLYNNGITVVVQDCEPVAEGRWMLAEPFVVNGCQTTRSIWEILQRRLASGGTGASEEYADWKARLDQGVVVTKVVKVGDEGGSRTADITRYTNSQNAVREKDFLALEKDFRAWKDVMADRYDLYLEMRYCQKLWIGDLKKAAA